MLSPERYTYGDSTPVDQWIEDAGGINAADHLTGNRQIDDDHILMMNPDMIIFTASWQPDQIAAWSSATVYADLNAVRTSRLVQFHYSLTDAALQSKKKPYVILLKRLLRLQN